MNRFVKKNIDEIKNSFTLRYFALFLGLVQFALYFLWTNQQPLLQFSNQTCSSFFSDCGAIIQLSELVFNIATYSHLGFTLLVLTTFYVFRFSTLYWFYLLYSGLLTLALYSSFYSFQIPSLYFLFVALFVFLFIPNKVSTLRWMIVLFYIQLALFKINPHWMSGLELLPIDELAKHGKATEWFAAVVVGWFGIVPLGLLTTKPRIFYVSIFSLIASHLFLYSLGFYFQSIVFLGLISLYAIEKVDDHLKKVSFQTFHFSSPNNLWTPAFLVLYLCMQYSPRLFGFDFLNPVLLNSQKYLLTCEVSAFSWDKGEIFEIKPNTEGLCNTDELYSSLKSQCKKPGQKISVFYKAKLHTTNEQVKKDFGQYNDDICQAKLTKNPSKELLWTQKTAL